MITLRDLVCVLRERKRERATLRERERERNLRGRECQPSEDTEREGGQGSMREVF